MRRLQYIIGIILVFAVCMSCGEDRTYEYEEWTSQNKTMQTMMHEWYLWGDSLKELQWKEYFGGMSEFFAKLTKQAPVEDRWSYCAIDTIQKDYHERGQFNHLDSYGLDFTTMTDPTRLTNQTYARVITVYPGSPADECGLRRGDFIGYVDGDKVTAGNTSKLKNGGKRTLTVNTLDFIGDSAIWSCVDTLNIAASRKVEDTQVMVARQYGLPRYTASYIMLSNLSDNGFAEVIKRYEDTDRMIVDLRLCNDGTLENAIALASYLAGRNALSKVFCKTIWNSSKQSLNQTYSFDEAICSNSVGFDKVYIITGSYTQGAAEWLINGLKGALGENLVVIGINTTGQNVLLKAISSDFKYTLYPAVAYVSDADGNYNYGEGIIPDYEIDELMYHPLRDYGDINETVLHYIFTLEE